MISSLLVDIKSVNLNSRLIATVTKREHVAGKYHVEKGTITRAVFLLLSDDDL